MAGWTQNSPYPSGGDAWIAKNLFGAVLNGECKPFPRRCDQAQDRDQRPTGRMVVLVFFYKELRQTDSSRRNMLTLCKTDYLSSGKYPFTQENVLLLSEVPFIPW